MYIWVTVKEDSKLCMFFVRGVRETLQSDRLPALSKAITWEHTRQSIKLGVNQTSTVVHIHRMDKTDEGNSSCGALFPAVTISCGILLTMPYGEREREEGFFSDILSDNLAINICCARSPCQAREPFPQH